MTPEELRNTISQPEGLKLDFKREYKLNSPTSAETDKQTWNEFIKGQWDEFIRDILALANGNVGASRQTGQLVIGVDDVLLPDGTRNLFDTLDLHLEASQILAAVNSACDPPIADIFLERFVIDGKSICVISIPPSPYIHETTRQLNITKGSFDNTGKLRHSKIAKTYTARTVFIRRGENIYPATNTERIALAADKSTKPVGTSVHSDLFTIVEWDVSMGDSYVIKARIANPSSEKVAIVKTAFVRVHEFRQHPIEQMDRYLGAPIKATSVARLRLPLEKKGVFVWLNPHHYFSYGEVEDLKIYVDPQEGYQFIFSFGFHWHYVGEQHLRELETGYLQVGHRGTPVVSVNGFIPPPPASGSHSPTMGNPNLDIWVKLNIPLWKDDV